MPLKKKNKKKINKNQIYLNKLKKVMKYPIVWYIARNTNENNICIDENG